MKQLDLIITYSSDIGMHLGLDKCAYLYIERGKQKSLDKNLSINGIIIKELKENEKYKYLGQDESVEYDGPLNKKRGTNKYLKRTRKIWSSELNSLNTFIAHYSLAVPVLAPTFGILDWTRSALSEIDVSTRKLMSMTGSFHVNSNGGRGLQNIMEVYEERIVSLKQHLEQEVNKENKLLQLVWNHEQESLIKRT